MSRYRKLPVEIDAVQWTGDNPDDCRMFLGSDLARYRADSETIQIHTLEGVMNCPLGHWIIRGVAGEHYSCEPAIFQQTYEKAE